MFVIYDWPTFSSATPNALLHTNLTVLSQFSPFFAPHFGIPPTKSSQICFFQLMMEKVTIGTAGTFEIEDKHEESINFLQIRLTTIFPTQSFLTLKS